MITEHLAVVGGVDHAGSGGEAGFIKRAEHAADLLVQEGDHAVIGGDGAAEGELIEGLLDGLNAPLPLHGGMVGPGVGGPAAGEGN